MGSPGEGCGDPVPVHCNTHGGAFWTKSHCLNRECPDCKELWANKEAQRAAGRLAWGKKTFDHSRFAQGDTRRSRIVHVVVSMYDDGRPMNDFKPLAY